MQFYVNRSAISIVSNLFHIDHEVCLGSNMGPSPLGLKEIDGLLVPPGKAYSLLTAHDALKSFICF